jgi:hypothetical protein
MIQAEILARTTAWAEAFVAPMPDGLDHLLSLASEDVRFADPFNDVRGKPSLAAVLTHMVETTEDPRFEILDIAASDKAGYIRWRFAFKMKRRPKGPAWRFEGMSEILIGPDGLVTAHLDHWDSGPQLLAKLPGIGWINRRVLNALAITPPRT